GAAPEGPGRPHISAVQPPRRAQRPRERGPTAAVARGEREGPRSARATRPRPRRDGRQGWRKGATPVGRSTAARRHRPCAGRRRGGPALRSADHFPGWPPRARRSRHVGPPCTGAGPGGRYRDPRRPRPAHRRSFDPRRRRTRDRGGSERPPFEEDCMSREAHSLPLVLATAVLLSGCGLHGKPNVDRTKALAGSHVTAAVTAPDLEEPNQVVAPGVVEAWGGNVELSPGEPGWIAKILASEGGRVEARQVLATLDDEAQRASVDLAKADLAEAEATFAKTQNGATVEELRQARAENEAGQVRAELARHDATRSDRLGSDRVLAPAEVERVSAEARVQTAIANASAAKLASLERGSRSEDRSAGRNRVVAARARVALAEVGLARRQVVAPIAGVVLLSRFHVGEFFNVGGVPLFVLGDTSSLQVRLEVDEIDAFRVKDGAPPTLKNSP